MVSLPKKLYTLEQAAEYLIVPKQTVSKWLRDGRLKGIKVGGLWRIPEESLEEFLHQGQTDKDGER